MFEYTERLNSHPHLRENKNETTDQKRTSVQNYNPTFLTPYLVYFSRHCRTICGRKMEG